MSESHDARATITFNGRSITFEGPAEFVSAEVAKYTGATIDQTVHGTDVKDNQVSPMSERELVRAKKPASHPETVAVLAFALAESGLKEFTADDIKRAYLRADVRPPKVAAQAIRDAKNNFDYVEPAGATGMYRLTSHGERTVRFDLPRGR
jgi:hypothetical protein